MVSGQDVAVAAVGEAVTGWHGVEEAVRDRGDESQFGDELVDCLQLVHLVATLASGGVLAISTYQDDAYFGLEFSTARPDPWSWSGIYRARTFPELPTGPIESVRVHEEVDVLDEALVRIAGAELLLVAAELYESSKDGSLGWHRYDGSVLAFTSITAADLVDWIPARQSTAARFGLDG